MLTDEVGRRPATLRSEDPARRVAKSPRRPPWLRRCDRVAVPPISRHSGGARHRSSRPGRRPTAGISLARDTTGILGQPKVEEADSGRRCLAGERGRVEAEGVDAHLRSASTAVGLDDQLTGHRSAASMEFPQPVVSTSSSTSSPAACRASTIALNSAICPSGCPAAPRRSSRRAGRSSRWCCSPSSWSGRDPGGRPRAHSGAPGAARPRSRQDGAGGRWPRRGRARPRDGEPSAPDGPRRRRRARIGHQEGGGVDRSAM